MIDSSAMAVVIHLLVNLHTHPLVKKKTSSIETHRTINPQSSSVTSPLVNGPQAKVSVIQLRRTTGCVVNRVNILHLQVT